MCRHAILETFDQPELMTILNVSIDCVMQVPPQFGDWARASGLIRVVGLVRDKADLTARSHHHASSDTSHTHIQGSMLLQG